MKGIICIVVAVLVYAGHLAIIKVSALMQPIISALEVVK